MTFPLFLLDRAQRLMPEAIPRPARGDMLVTLLLWKILSDHAHLPIQTAQPDAPAQPVPAPLLIFPAASLFAACDLASHAYPGDAICHSLTTLCNAQPESGLHAILRPQRFAASDCYAHLFQLNPVWPAIMDLIGGMPFIAKQESGSIISQAVAQFGLAAAPTPVLVATLMARLLKLWRASAVYVPACGHGELLLAVVTEATRRYGAQHRLQLRAQEADPAAWAGTCIQLLARHLPYDQIRCGDVLAQPQLLTDSGLVMQHDAIMATLPEQPMPWQRGQGTPLDLYRFPRLPPSDGRVAMVWHMLSSLRSCGSMALLIPASLLANSASFTLRQKLLAENWLDAVITLPKGRTRQATSPMRLLLIKKRRKRDTVAFIDPAPVRPLSLKGGILPYDQLAIWAAHRRFHRGQTHADLHPFTRTTLLAQAANLDKNTLLPEPQAMRQQITPPPVAQGEPMADLLATI